MQVCTVCYMHFDTCLNAVIHYTLYYCVYNCMPNSPLLLAPYIQDAYRRLQYRKAKQIDRIQMVRDLGPDLLTHFGLGGTGAGGGVGDGGLSIL